MAAGQEVYNTYCRACHMDDGGGVAGLNPPLKGTDWVTGDKTRLIRVILEGLSEVIEIDGQTYQNAMAAHNFLTDQQIADVLTYLRQSFGNDAGPLTPEEVATVRAGPK
jgi:mono/diheme cytochrome c family protein